MTTPTPTEAAEKIQSICQHGIALAAEATPGPWEHQEIDGWTWVWRANAPFYQGVAECKIDDTGESPQEIADAAFIAHSRTLLPALATALQEATDYINGFTTCDGEDCDCRHHTAAKSVLARIVASLTAAQTP